MKIQWRRRNSRMKRSRRKTARRCNSDVSSLSVVSPTQPVSSEEDDEEEKPPCRPPMEVICSETASVRTSSSKKKKASKPPKPPPPSSPPRISISLGSGSLSETGHVKTFVPSPTRICSKSYYSSRSHPPPSTDSSGSAKSEAPYKMPFPLVKAESSSSPKSLKEGVDSAKKSLARQASSCSSVKQPIVFRRSSSSFLRVADLRMDEALTLSVHSSASSDESKVAPEDFCFPNFHHVAVDPPPGVAADPDERWVSLDDGEGNSAPIAPYAVSALTTVAINCTFDQPMWTPADGKTTKAIKTIPNHWQLSTWQQEGLVPTLSSNQDLDQILVWSGSFKHGLYGSDLPAVRAAGFIDIAPVDLMDLLVDSGRVKEYNKISLGRTDVLVLQDDMAGPTFGGITKVMKSQSKPAFVRKPLEFTSILHARALDDGSGYILVTRAVTSPDHQESGSLKSEILMGVTLIKGVEGDDHRCLTITVNHLRCPMVPTMIAKRLGLQAAQGFFHDLRTTAATLRAKNC